MKTSKTYRLSDNSDARGGALVVVVILCAITLIMVGSYLATLSSQSRVINRATLQKEARNAAEGMAEYALLRCIDGPSPILLGWRWQQSKPIERLHPFGS